MGFELNAFVITGFKISPKFYLHVSHDNLTKFSGSGDIVLRRKSDILLKKTIMINKMI